MGDELNQWLKTQLKHKGWNASEFARRADLSDGYVRNVLLGKSQPGAKFYQGIARAFGLTLDTVEEAIQRLEQGQEFELAPSNSEEMSFREVSQLVSSLTPEQYRKLIHYLKQLILEETDAPKTE